jgi:biotin carboxyl carrier protein
MRMQCSLVLIFMVQLASLLEAACIELSAQPRQGALLWGTVAPGTKVTLNQELLGVSHEGVVVFGLGRDARESAILRTESEYSCEQVLKVAKREYRIQQVDGVPQRTVTPDAKHLDRILREARLVKKSRLVNTPRSDFLKGFHWPLHGPITGVYGSQRVYNGTRGRPHFGVDIAAPAGTQVSAPAPGRVVLAEKDLFFSGGTLIIDHGMEVFSSYLHLSKILVSVGDWVEPGMMLAAVGATGRVTGPHLDWRMNWRDQRVDPQLLVEPMIPLAE